MTDKGMTMNKILGDGNPAFPVPGLKDDPSFNGMSLRDYFAAKAMLGFLCEPVEGVQEAMFYELGDKSCRAIAESSYALADAMLAARGA